MTDLVDVATENTDAQFLVYSSLARFCEESIVTRREGKLGVFSYEHIYGKVMFAPTGKVGIMGKSFLAEAFAGDNNDNTIPTIFCIFCTEAVQYGVSSKQCNK